MQLGINATSIVKYFYDHFDIKFITTGSSSFYLKDRFSESLAGRKRIFEMYPLSFREFLYFKEKTPHLPPSMPCLHFKPQGNPHS
ncbi:MAG: AAA family ATPase [Saprospirales bacterium]|nr:AAA family ATPase [Saprospirales bacterium]